jgi:hypothetical protein
MSCRLGGVLYVAPHGKPGETPIEMKVYRAASPSESEDLKKLCSMPEVPEGMPASHQRRIAVEIYGETLTSGTWRSWWNELRQESDRPAPDVRKKQGKVLADAAAAANLKDCWFATNLVSD